jgi:hypothetical protein
MQTIIADALEVIRIGFWALFWSLLGSCLIALVFAACERLTQRSTGAARSVYSGSGARNGTILMLVGIAALACMWTAVAMLGALPRADTLGEQVVKAVTGTDAAHVGLLIGSVISVLVFSFGSIAYLYSERTIADRPAPATASTEPVKAA